MYIYTYIGTCMNAYIPYPYPYPYHCIIFTFNYITVHYITLHSKVIVDSEVMHIHIYIYMYAYTYAL